MYIALKQFSSAYTIVASTFMLMF